MSQDWGQDDGCLKGQRIKVWGGGGGRQAVKVERAKNELGGVDVYEECIGWQ